MDDLPTIGRWLLVLGLGIAAIGVLFALGGRIPFLGRLPGDIRIERDGVVVFIPLGTMLVLSLVLTIVLNLIGRR